MRNWIVRLSHPLAPDLLTQTLAEEGYELAGFFDFDFGSCLEDHLKPPVRVSSK